MSELVYLPVAELYPHPDNPRKVVDDLEELAASIKANGVLQNLTVVKGHGESQDGYTVIIGHRRLAAAKLAGLEQVPCTIAEMTAKEQIQTMLLENMQRKDLKVYEESHAFQMLLDFGDTIQEVSEKSGFSETTIRKRIKLNELDQKKLKEAVDARQIDFRDFDKLSKIDDVKSRNELLQYIGTKEFLWNYESCLRKQNIKKYMGDVKKAVRKLKAKKISQGDTYGSKYDKTVSIKIADWPTEKDKLPAESKQELFYVLDESWGELALYVKRKIEKAPPRPKEEIEKEKRIAEAWKYVEEQSKIFYSLRKKFIDSFVVTKKNTAEVMKGAILSEIALKYNYGYWEVDEMLKAFGVEPPKDNGTYIDADIKTNLLMEAYRNNDGRGLAKVVYILFCDKDNKLPTRHEYKREHPKYEKSNYITILYEWLVSLGYEMSEKEKALVYGSDEIYDKPKAAKKGNAEPDQGEPPANPESEPEEV